MGGISQQEIFMLFTEKLARSTRFLDAFFISSSLLETLDATYSIYRKKTNVVNNSSETETAKPVLTKTRMSKPCFSCLRKNWRYPTHLKKTCPIHLKTHIYIFSVQKNGCADNISHLDQPSWFDNFGGKWLSRDVCNQAPHCVCQFDRHGWLLPVLVDVVCTKQFHMPQLIFWY